MTTIITTIGGILLVLVAGLVLIGQRGCEESITGLKEPEKVLTPETEPNNIQMFVYQAGEKIGLDANSPHFMELQTLMEQRLISATEKYQKLGVPRSSVDLVNGNPALEMIYLDSKEFKINPTGETISPTRLLVLLTEGPITIIYYALQDQDYIEGPYINEKDTGDVIKILTSMNIQIKKEGTKINRLTLRVKLFIPPPGDEPLPLPIKVSIFRTRNGKKDKALLVEKFVSRDPKNSKEGILEFELPEGDYKCEAVSYEFPAKGYLAVSLRSDLEREIILYIIDFE